MTAIFNLTPQLAIGECTCTTFTKLHIGFGIEFAFAPKPPCVLSALAHLLAAFDDNRFEPHLREYQRGQNATGSKANNNRTLLIGRRKVGTCLRRKFIVGVGAGAHSGQTRVGRENDFFCTLHKHHINLIDKQYLALLTSVIAAFENAKIHKFLSTDTKCIENRLRQLRICVVEG